MKVALLDRRFAHSRQDLPEKFSVKPRIKWNEPTQNGNENTFAVIDTFDDVLTGPLRQGTDYTILQDYDLIYLRIRELRSREVLKLHEKGQFVEMVEIEPIMDLRKTCPNSIIVGYTDEYVGVSRIDHSMLDGLKKMAQYLDAIVCGFGRDYQADLFSQLGIENYYHLPYAGDVYHWKKYYKPPEEKEYRVSGMWHIRSYSGQGRGDRNHTTTFSIMKKLQDNHGIKCRFYLNFDGWKLEDALRGHISRLGLNCELMQHMGSDEFYNSMASDLIFIEEYPAPAYSRATVVSAAVGTPSISNYLNDPSRVCFPELTVEWDEKNKMVRLAEKLINDKLFYKQQAEAGFNNSEYYYYPAHKERVLELYDILREKKQ